MIKFVIFIVGPTATGKSDIALKLAKLIPAEIISCDSMQLYKRMDIGTAKPTKQEQKAVPHHLLDLIASDRPFSVFDYRAQALEAINAILKQGKIPLVVGGSGLYVKALVDGLEKKPGQDPKFRKKYEELISQKGLAYVYKELKKKNPKRAEELHPNDEKRIIRALEIEEQEPDLFPVEKEPGLKEMGIGYKIYGVKRDRAELYKRVEERIDVMIQKGWLDEVKKLKKKGLSQTAQEAIGYKELLSHLNGKCDLEDAVVETKKRTRHLVKKQFTWFLRDKRINWFELKGKQSAEKTAQSIQKDLKKQKIIK